MVAQEFVMTDYYATDCGHCQQFAPVWSKAASSSHADTVWKEAECSGPGWSVGRDAGDCDSQGITSYPTVKLLHYDQHGKVDDSWKYEGPRTPEALETFAIQKIADYRNGEVATRSIHAVSGLQLGRQACLSSFL